MTAKLCAAVGVLLLGDIAVAGQSSRFLTEYPSASAKLEKATMNVTCSGRLQANDYEGAVRFSTLGGTDAWLMKSFDATTSTLAWKRCVESYSKDWYFRLDGSSASAPYEFKGADFPQSMSEQKARQLSFLRWLRCNKFCGALFTVYGFSVNELIARDGFSILSEGPSTSKGRYEVQFTVKSISELADHNFLRGRMLFDEEMSWALVEYDLMYELLPSGTVDYVLSRAEPQMWDDGSILPQRVETRAGGAVDGKATKLGSPKWPGNEIHETAVFDEVTIGQLTEEDFLPSSFGFPDHLVLGTVAFEKPLISGWWLLLFGVNGVAFLWWVYRKFKSHSNQQV